MYLFLNLPTWSCPAAAVAGSGVGGGAVGGRRRGGSRGVHISAGRKSLLQACDALIHVCPLLLSPPMLIQISHTARKRERRCENGTKFMSIGMTAQNINALFFTIPVMTFSSC